MENEERGFVYHSSKNLRLRLAYNLVVWITLLGFCLWRKNLIYFTLLVAICKRPYGESKRIAITLMHASIVPFGYVDNGEHIASTLIPAIKWKRSWFISSEVFSSELSTVTLRWVSSTMRKIKVDFCYLCITYIFVLLL